MFATLKALRNGAGWNYTTLEGCAASRSASAATHSELPKDWQSIFLTQGFKANTSTPGGLPAWGPGLGWN